MTLQNSDRPGGTWHRHLVFSGFFLVVVVAAFFRYASVSQTIVSVPIIRDAKDYYHYAVNLRVYGVYSRSAPASASPQPDAVRTPGYPLFLRAFAGLQPIDRFLAVVSDAQMLLGITAVAGAYYLFCQFLSPAYAIGAGLLCALSPHLIVLPSYLLTETLFHFMIVLSGIATFHYFRKRTLAWALVSGFVFGLTWLVRPSVQYFPILLVGYCFFYFQNRAEKVNGLWILCGFLLVILPWKLRNLITLGVFSDDRLLINFFHHGMYPGFSFQEISASFGFPYLADPRSPEIGKSLTAVLREILARFLDDPVRYLVWYLCEKPFTFWSWDYVQGWDIFIYKVDTSPFFSNPVFIAVYRGMKWVHYPLVIAGILGTAVSVLAFNPISDKSPKAGYAAFFALMMLYFTGIHMAGAPFPRYSVPLRPYLYAMAMFFVSWGVSLAGRHKRARADSSFGRRSP